VDLCGQAVQEEYFWEKKTIRFLETTGTTCPVTHHHIPEDVNPQAVTGMLIYHFRLYLCMIVPFTLSNVNI